jgi:hypothetical protein
MFVIVYLFVSAAAILLFLLLLLTSSRVVASWQSGVRSTMSLLDKRRYLLKELFKAKRNTSGDAAPGMLASTPSALVTKVSSVQLAASQIDQIVVKSGQLLHDALWHSEQFPVHVCALQFSSSQAAIQLVPAHSRYGGPSLLLHCVH